MALFWGFVHPRPHLDIGQFRPGPSSHCRKTPAAPGHLGLDFEPPARLLHHRASPCHAARHGVNQIVNGSLTIRWQPRVCVVTIRNDRGRRRHIGSPPVQVVTSRMPATVDSSTDAERELDTETAAEKSVVTLNYEAMLAALNALLAEMREERRQAEASGSFVDAQHRQEPATVQPNAWVEAHAMLSKK